MIKRGFLILIPVLFAGSAFAADCSYYTNMNENQFTKTASRKGSSVADTLSECISNHCEDVSTNNRAACLNKANYYESIATFFTQKSIQGQVNHFSMGGALGGALGDALGGAKGSSDSGSNLPKSPPTHGANSAPSTADTSAKHHTENSSPTSAPQVTGQDNNPYDNINF